MTRFVSSLSLCFVALGCAVGPDYERPPVKSPPKWREPSAAAQESIANLPWWELFKDPQLHTLIKTALHENRDLKIAVERIEEARANFGISKAELYPQVNAQVRGGALNPSDGSLTHTPEGTNTTGLYNAEVGFSWELDFFGRIRRANEAAKAAMFSTEYARRAVAMSLVSDVATAYVDLRGLDRRLAIGQRTLVSRKENVEFSRTRFEGAVSNEVDLRQAESELYRIQALVYELEKLVKQKENELSFLVGRNPGEVLRNRGEDEQPIPPAVPAGLPAQLLERRPDVRRAEMDLWSATARIGEARAMLYPRISLTGSYGLASTDLGNFVDPASQSWNLFAGLLQPIFNGGANIARVEMRESQQRQAVYSYERTLLQALREVEDALIGLGKAGEQRGAQKERLVAQRKVLELADLRYKGGVANYLEVLDAQRSLFDTEIDEAGAVSEHARSLIRLYKALGGGWPAPKAGDVSDPETPDLAPAAAAARPPASAPLPAKN
ncbi:MAG TPA: efflux transporter outer membrane subunit [Polyangiaceae bacterium]